MPGLANLVGYAVIKASQSHPEPWDFHKFVDLHGGHIENPITKAHDQEFGFYVDPAHLGSALYR